MLDIIAKKMKAGAKALFWTNTALILGLSMAALALSDSLSSGGPVAGIFLAIGAALIVLNAVLCYAGALLLYRMSEKVATQSSHVRAME